MSDRRQINQSEVFELLGQLKNKKVEYPEELLAARRAGFIALVNTIQVIPQSGSGQGGSGSSSGSGSSGGSGGSSGSGFSGSSTIPGASAHALETVLGYVLAGAVTVLAGTVAYVYQDEIRDLINPPAPTVEMIDSVEPTPTPVSTATEIPTPTIVVTTATPPPPDKDGQTTSSEPEPTKTNPGLHLGNTKTPKPPK